MPREHSHFLLYADDLKIFRRITTSDDCLKLQSDLDLFTIYCKKNKLKLSLPKCKSITFTKKNNVIGFQYSLCDTVLEKVTLIRDLGIFMDSKLHFDVHINHITGKAFQLYSFVMRSAKPFRCPASYLLLYKSLVRSQLEYATSIWNPFYAKYKEQIEMVQRKFVRSMHFRCFHSKMSCDALLQKYSLPKLEVRRIILDVMLLYNISHNKFDCNELTNQICLRVPYRSYAVRQTRKPTLFAPKTTRTHAGERSPLHRLMGLYNKYFYDVDIFSSSPATYKKNICEALRTLECE